ncbi:thioredoxin-like protein [Calocera viscosa TUFC12733]|uniref:Thioredoxin-like protein n=1 Tax=Calocera viscosa (strain TUFC12733) TaxID=1330018 RepID=A0A167LNP5_CALVF|nr:thioredoxin-like protein [Calocera viscosa TUFC12733]
MSMLSASRRLPTFLPAARLTTRTFASTSRRAEHFTNADSEAFKKRVEEGGSKPVIVDFYADWCGPCRMLSPLLEKLTADSKLTSGKELDLMTINTDDQNALALDWEVTALPTVIVFKEGKPVKRFVGFMPMPKLQEFVEDV